MISLDQARSRILDALAPLDQERIPLHAALHRVAAEPLQAQLDAPAFDNAAVDGFALRTQDLPPNHPENPARLRVHAIAAAGDPPLANLPQGTCARIFTGAPLPRDANAVIMQEDTAPAPEGQVNLLAPVSPWEGVRFAGEDFRRGNTLVPAGQRLRPAHLGLLAAAGFSSLPVFQRPRVSLLTSGNELVDPGQPIPPGKLPDSNQLLLAALALAAHVNVVHVARIPDALEPTIQALRQTAQVSDVILTTGGVSVGDSDFLKPAFEASGGHLEFWRIAMKPGRPFAWGRLGSCHWFGLPGNPVSAFVTWQRLVRPALRRLEGDTHLLGLRVAARLAEPLTNHGDRLHILRMQLDPDGTVRPVGTQASHIQSGLASANALLEMPASTTWEAGRTVEVELLEGL